MLDVHSQHSSLGLLASCVILILGTLQAPARPLPPAAEPPLPAAQRIAAVRPLRADLFAPPAPRPRARRLMGEYYASILEWDQILLDQIQPAPGRPGCRYYGLGRHVEDDLRPITYAALVNAFLAEFATPPGRPELPRPQRERMRGDAVAALRYLVQSHVTGSGTCVNGQQWGNQWQSAMWARAAGLAGWILWIRLDPPLRDGVSRIVEFEADRFLHLPPKSSEFSDTGAEENAWNAHILTLACNMMPAHPRAPRWATEAKRWMANALSVAADARDDTPGDDGRRIREWVQTVNLHPDFTLENHGLVHVGYLINSMALLLENAIPYLLTGNEVPRACLHHASDCFTVVKKCMGWDGAPIFFSGNDWKLYHSQNSELLIHPFMALLAQDRDGAYLEEDALPILRRMQRAEGGYYNVRRDLEFSGLCATRLIEIYLARLVLGEGPKPTPADRFQASIQGVTHLATGKVLIHRTPTKFVSFSWAKKRMALALPQNGSWTIWPHFASYTGLLDEKDASDKQAKVLQIKPSPREDGFTVTALLSRLKGAVHQSILYASLPGDVTVYIERLELRPGAPFPAREGGVIGLAYELGVNQRTLHGAGGKTVTWGVGGERPRVVNLKTDWLNLDERVGYIVRRFPHRPNLMRYHDETSGSGRVPVLQEWFSLIGDEGNPPQTGRPEWACIVTFLNQSKAETDAWRRRVEFSVDGDVAVCRLGRDEVRADFSQFASPKPLAR